MRGPTGPTGKQRETPPTHYLYCFHHMINKGCDSIPNSPGQKTISVKPEVYELLRDYKYDVRVDTLGEAIEHAIRKARQYTEYEV